MKTNSKLPVMMLMTGLIAVLLGPGRPQNFAIPTYAVSMRHEYAQPHHQRLDAGLTTTVATPHRAWILH